MGRGAGHRRTAPSPAARRWRSPSPRTRTVRSCARIRSRRQPHRRGRVPSRLSPADGARDRARRRRASRGATRSAGAHVARAALRYLHNQADQGTGCPLTMTYACVPSLGSSPSSRASGCRASVAAAYDPRACRRRQKNGNTLGHGDDGEAGRLRRARQHDARHPVGARGAGAALRARRAQVVLLGADVRRVPRARAGGGGAVVLPASAVHAGRRAQRDAHSAAEGQARRLEQRERGGGVSRRARVDGGRAGPRRRDDPRDGRAHAAGLHDRRRRADAAGARAGGSPRAAPQGVRQAAGRAAADAERARRSRARVARRPPRSRARRARRRRERARCEARRALARIATAIGKYWVCKRCAPFVNEAQECLGGAGYVEESNLPRLYRQAPLNSIWEGSGNIQCLDVLRALAQGAGEPARRSSTS